MNPKKFFFAIEFFFSFPLHSLLFYNFFIVFACLAKEITTIKKKMRENKLENKSKTASHKGFIWIKKTRN